VTDAESLELLVDDTSSSATASIDFVTSRRREHVRHNAYSPVGRTPLRVVTRESQRCDGQVVPPRNDPATVGGDPDDSTDVYER
jgi:hypothetical protein